MWITNSAEADIFLVRVAFSGVYRSRAPRQRQLAHLALGGTNNRRSLPRSTRARATRAFRASSSRRTWASRSPRRRRRCARRPACVLLCESPRLTWPLHSQLGIRASSTCTLNFDEIKIPAENLLGEEGQGYKCVSLSPMRLPLSLPSWCSFDPLQVRHRDSERGSRRHCGADGRPRTGRVRQGGPVHVPAQAVRPGCRQRALSLCLLPPYKSKLLTQAPRRRDRARSSRACRCSLPTSRPRSRRRAS